MRVNLTGLQAEGVMFQAAVTDAVGHIVKQTSEQPSKYLERHARSSSTVSLQGKRVQMPGLWKNRQEGDAPQAVWWLGRDYTRLRGNGGAGRDNCPKGQAKAGRNTAKRGEQNKIVQKYA